MTRKQRQLKDSKKDWSDRIRSYALEFKRKEHLKKGIRSIFKCRNEVKVDELVCWLSQLREHGPRASFARMLQWVVSVQVECAGVKC